MLRQEFSFAKNAARRGFIPAINVYPPNFVMKHNTDAVVEAFSKYCTLCEALGEWVYLREMLKNLPAILEDQQVVAEWTKKCDEALLHTVSFDEYKKLYSSYADEHGGALKDVGILYLNRYHLVYELLEVDRPSSVLDVGCGDGAFSDCVMEIDSVSEYTIADISEGAQRVVDVLKAKRPHVAMDLHVVKEGLFDWPEKKYEAVMALEIIEHVPDQVEFLRHLKTRVSDGGAVYISTPNTAGWMVPEEKKGPRQHITANTPATLVRKAKEAGLDLFDVPMLSQENHIIARFTPALERGTTK